MAKSTPQTRVAKQPAKKTRIPEPTKPVKTAVVVKKAAKVTVSKLKKNEPAAKPASTINKTKELVIQLEESENIDQRIAHANELGARQAAIINELQTEIDEIKKSSKKRKQEAELIGIIRLDDGLDHSDMAVPGDIVEDSTFSFKTEQVVCKGLTLEVAKDAISKSKKTAHGTRIAVPPAIKKNLEKCVRRLEKDGVLGITGDSGFLQYYQDCVGNMTDLPVFLSSLMQCGALATAYQSDEKILVLTADSTILDQQTMLKLLDAIHLEASAAPRFHILGCQDIPGLDDLMKGKDVYLPQISQSLVHLVQKEITKHPDIRAMLLECTELPTFGDALREEFNMPVFDAVTLINHFHSSKMDNPRY